MVFGKVIVFREKEMNSVALDNLFEKMVKINEINISKNVAIVEVNIGTFLNDDNTVGSKVVAFKVPEIHSKSIEVIVYTNKTLVFKISFKSLTNRKQ